MNLMSIAKHVSSWTKANSPLVLTVVAVGGVVSTAVLSFKAAEDAAEEYQDEYHEVGPISRTEHVKRYWHHYLPPVLSVAFTTTAIVCAHKMNVRKQASVAAALAISEKTLHEYREKVAEIVGQRKSDQAMEMVAQDRIEKTISGEERPPWDSEMTVWNPGDTMCYDMYTGRYFQSSRQRIENGVNMLNSQINNSMYASLNDFFDTIGLPQTSMGVDLGWNSDQLLQIEFTSHLAPNDKPCLAIYYVTPPKPNYYKF